MIDEAVESEEPPRKGVRLLETTAVEVYQPSAGVPVVYEAQPVPDAYNRPLHSKTVAMLFNVMLPIAAFVNLGSAVVSYAMASSGAFLPGFYNFLGSTDLSLFLWVPAVVALVAILVTSFTYVLSLDDRRERRPVRRLHVLWASFFIFLSGAALGALKVTPEMVWPFLCALVLSLLLPFAMQGLEVMIAGALTKSAEGFLQTNGPSAARGIARTSLRFRPGDRHAEQVYGLALARTGRGAAALPYLVRNSSEITKQPAPVIAALVDVFEAAGNEEHSLLALETVYRVAPSKKIFERLMNRWRSLGRKEDVLRELQALPPKDRKRWHETLQELIFENGDIERCRAFCREIEMSEGPPFAQAHRCYTRLLELHPQDLPTHRALIELGRRRGDADQSAVLLEQVIEMDEAHALPDRRGLVAYYWSRGDRKNMLRHLNRIYEQGQATLDEKLRIVEECFTEGDFARVEALVGEDSDLGSSPRALMTLAHALVERNREEESLDTIQKIRQLVPEGELLGTAEGLEKNIRSRLLTGELDILRQKMNDAPDDLNLRFEYYDKLVPNGESERVVSELEDFLRRKPEQLPRVQREIRQLVTRHGRDMRLLGYLADLNLREGDVARAFELYEERVQGKPNAAALLHESCQKILQTAPEYLPALLTEVDYFSKINEPVQALEYLDRYHGAGGDRNARLRNLELDAALAAGKLERAEAAGKLMLQSDSTNAEFLARMAQIAMDLHHFGEATAYLQRAQQIDPDNELYPPLLRVIDKKQKRFRIEEIRQLVAEGKADAALHEEMGDLYQDIGEYSAAMTEYQRASHGAPERHVARAKLGYVFARRGLHQEADETLHETALRTDMAPEELAVLKELFYKSAELMSEGGETEGALRVFRRVLRIEAGYKDVVAHVERLQRAEKKK
ncbi:MAG: tetratricopeptide repeat protein [Candidatus Sumerlaeaceae bacterium]